MLTPDSDFALPFPVSMQRNGKTQNVRIVLLPAQLEMVYMISGALAGNSPNQTLAAAQQERPS